MEKEEMQALIERIKEVCPPESKVEIVPIQQAKNICLVIVQIPPIADDAAILGNLGHCSEKLYSILCKNKDLKKAYLWATHCIDNLHYDSVLPLLENEAVFRVVYFCGIKFALYTHSVGCFGSGSHIFNYVGMNGRTNYKYVGISRRSEWLIDFLKSTTNPI